MAQKVYDLRTRSGLTQRQLADRVGTTVSAICGLEEAAYEGPSLSMLGRIVAALGHTVEVNFLPANRLGGPKSRPGRLTGTGAARKISDRAPRTGRPAAGRKGKGTRRRAGTA